MESLSYAFEGRALLFSDDTDFQLDGLMRNKNLSRKWDGEDAVESMGFVDPLLPDTAKKAFLSNQYLESSGDDTNDHSGKSVQSASSITFNSFVDFGMKLSSSVNKVNNEKFAGPKESDGNQFSMDNSSPEQSISAKRSRITNYQSTVPTCQVFGCNKDLSSSKDYHKRHKVCDVHSKTPVVIVNGIQQRFCQQCSRFHILAEFDEGKRSCRKRLAGHNERRRKPQFDSHLGSTYFTTDASNTSLIFSRILPNGFFGLQYNEPSNHSQQLNTEEKPSQLFPNSVLHFHGVGKQYPSKNCLNAPSSLPECSVGPDSGFALSLLSAQSQNISSSSEGISTAQPIISKQNDPTALFTFQNSTAPFGESTISNSSIAELDRLPVVSSTTVTAGSETAFSQERDTVGLLELSLHLQRVEEQRYYGDVKLENGIFCDSSVT